MSQADSVNTTSRRGFLSRGAATVAGGAGHACNSTGKLSFRGCSSLGPT